MASAITRCRRYVAIPPPAELLCQNFEPGYTLRGEGFGIGLFIQKRAPRGYAIRERLLLARRLCFPLT